MAEQLVVDCRNCGETFPSPIQMDRGSFEGSDISGNTMQCPHCGATETYDKEHMRFE